MSKRFTVMLDIEADDEVPRSVAVSRSFKARSAAVRYIEDSSFFECCFGDALVPEETWFIPASRIISASIVEESQAGRTE